MQDVYSIKIEDNSVIISENNGIYCCGHKVDFDKISTRDCLLLMNKFKSLYFTKLKQEIEE